MATASKKGGELKGASWAVAGWLVAAISLALLAAAVLTPRDMQAPILVRNTVLDEAGARIWRGAFVNPSPTPYEDLFTEVTFLDAEGESVSSLCSHGDALSPGQRIDFRAPIPASAVRVKVTGQVWRAKGRRLVGEASMPRVFDLSDDAPRGGKARRWSS